MGLYAQLYLGPFATCQVVTRMETVKVRACTGCKQTQKVSEPFCGSCGAPIGSIERSEGRRTSPYDVLKNERLTPVVPEGKKDIVYFVSNETQTPRKFHLESPHHEALDDLRGGPGPDMPMIEAEVQWFLERYAAELDDLRKAYPTVTVSWGVHYYLR
jgi:hypothetical protein